MPGDFGEFTVNIGLGINFLAGGTLFLNSNDTLSYIFQTKNIQHRINIASNPFIEQSIEKLDWVMQKVCLTIFQLEAC